MRALQWPCLQEAVEKREAEIVRLGAEAGAGRDVDVTALQYRSEAQENLILQLNEQVRPLALLKCPSHSNRLACKYLLKCPLRSTCLTFEHLAKRPLRST